MDIVENRRERLRQWFENRTVPPEEKSYISQLINGKASFGERAARRLEALLGMGVGYLDRSPNEKDLGLEDFLKGPGAGYINAAELIELITLYKDASLKGREIILTSARQVSKSLGIKLLND